MANEKEFYCKGLCLDDVLRLDINDKDMVGIWNAYCEDKGKDELIIHENLSSNINDLFPDAGSFARCFLDGGDYDYSCDWLVVTKRKVVSFSDIACYASPLDYDEVAEWLINGGECPKKDLLQQGMKEWFVFDYFGDENKRTTDTEAYAVCDEMDVDYITADWDKLAEEVRKQLNQ